MTLTISMTLSVSVNENTHGFKVAKGNDIYFFYLRQCENTSTLEGGVCMGLPSNVTI